jgi:DNA-binding response OmpR family regulator
MRPHSTHDVLLVDPDLELRGCRALYLQMRGFRVAGARAADDTLLRLRAGFRPCVVLADPRLGGNDMWPLVDYLRADSVLATVPLVLVARDAEQVLSAERHGVHECIDPPSEPEHLVAAIERVCRRRSDATHDPFQGAIRPRKTTLLRRLPVPRPSTPAFPEPAPPLLRRLA